MAISAPPVWSFSKKYYDSKNVKKEIAKNPKGFLATMQKRVVPGPSDQEKLVRSQHEIAKQFRQKLPELKQQSYDLNRDISRRELAEGMVAADRAANRRGMLYGGVRSGLRSQAEGDVAANLADRTTQGNLLLEQQARDLENLAIKGGYDLRGDTQQAYNDTYNRVLSNRAQNAQFMNSLMGVVGNTVGGLLGQKAGSK